MRFPSLVSPWSSFRTTAYAGAILLGLSSCSAVNAVELIEARQVTAQDPAAECTPYYYAPSGSKISSFPQIWQPASILSNDSVAQAKWASIVDSIPTNISVKGTLTGNFSNVTYSNSDTDCWWTFSKCATPKLDGLPPDITNIQEPQTLGYGFDDGPNCSHNAFYDYLSGQNQKATMFFIGSNVMDWPLEAKRAITDGHEICVHTWSHRYMTACSSTDAFAELYYSTLMQAIKLVTGVTPTCWRPPFGDVDDRIRAIANGLGLRTILWQYDSNDWRAGTGNITAATVDGDYEAFIANAKSGLFDTAGAIILTHELNNFTMSEAIKYYPQLKDAFKYIIPIGVSLNKTQPYAETNYFLPTFEQYISGTTASTTAGTGSAPGSSSSSASSPSASDKASQTGAAVGLDPKTALHASMGSFLVLFGAVAVLIGA